MVNLRKVEKTYIYIKFLLKMKATTTIFFFLCSFGLFSQIEPASIGAKWTSAKYTNTNSSSIDRGILTKTGNSTFTFKWENAKKEVKTEYLTLKSSKEGMCHNVDIEKAMNELAISLGQEPHPKKGKCRICQYTIKGNADRKVIINWLSGGVDVEVELYDDFGSLIRSWRLYKE